MMSMPEVQISRALNNNPNGTNPTQLTHHQLSHPHLNPLFGLAYFPSPYREVMVDNMTAASLTVRMPFRFFGSWWSRHPPCKGS